VFPEETMKRHFETVAFVSVLAAALGILASAGHVAAADRVPGPEATSGASGSSSSRANYQADVQVDYHADYRVNGTGNRAKGTEDSPSRREDQRDFQRDWRNGPGVDRYGRTTSGWPR
jgi:hypothetical protein